MKKRINIPLLFLIIMIMPVQVFAGTEANLIVKTVLASQGPVFADTGLSDLIRELQSVFRYSSYRLLSQNRMNLSMNKTGTASLPENRMMKITPFRITGDRAELRLEIFKENSLIFQTVVQLLNHGSITVGGPTYKEGYLLFNISVSF